MTYNDLVRHYGSPAAAAAAGGYDRQRIYGWKIRNKIPTDSQIVYELLTEGALRADLPKEIRSA